MRRSPEELELERRQRELEELRAGLVEAELELATLRADLATFEQEYLQAIGPALAAIDATEARIAQAEAARHPADPTYAQAARQSKARANDSAAAVAGGRSIARCGTSPL